MSEKLAKGMECVECRAVYPIAPKNYSECCFAPLSLKYSPEGKSKLKEMIANGPNNFSRYLPLLPTSATLDYEVGLTPLVKADALAEALGIEHGNLYVKFDEGSLTSTFKDRGAAVVAQLVSEFNRRGYHFKVLGGTSTGNLASAIPAAARKINLESVVLVQQDAEEELIKKSLSFGAYVLVVNENYSNVNNVVKKILSFDENLTSSIAWVNIEFRPLYSQGAKTIGFEIAEQLGWKAPDNVVHPVAAGLSLWQIYEGLSEFKKFDLIPDLSTRMHAVQPTGCEPLVKAWEKGKPFEIVPEKEPKSIAKTLCVGDPSNGYQVLEALDKSNGSAVSVSDEEIKNGVGLVYQNTDWQTGPVGGTVVAGAKKLVEKGVINPKELTVLVLTDAFNPNLKNDYLASTIPPNRELRLEPDEKEIKRTLDAILEGIEK